MAEANVARQDDYECITHVGAPHTPRREGRQSRVTAQGARAPTPPNPHPTGGMGGPSTGRGGELKVLGLEACPRLSAAARWGAGGRAGARGRRAARRRQPPSLRFAAV